MLRQAQVTRALSVRQVLWAHLPFLQHVFGVRRMALFGSWAKGRASSQSDVDLLIEFDQPLGFRFFDLLAYLEAILGTSVDIITPVGLQHIRVDDVRRDIEEYLDDVTA